MSVSVSVVMPALNEEKAISSAVDRTLSSFDKYGIEGEIIVVNDGSTDATGDIIESLIKTHGNRIKTLKHPAPRGMGASFWDGARMCEKKAVTLMPGDNENDPDEILKYSGLLEHVDMVVPFVHNRNVRGFYRNFLSRLFCLIINVTFGMSFNYTNGTALYKRKILYEVDCESGGFFFLAEILIKLTKKGYLFAEVPYSLSRREGGASKAVSFQSFIRVTRDYLRLVKYIYFGKRYKHGKT